MNNEVERDSATVRSSDTSIPVVEETIHVHRKNVDAGGFRLIKKTEEQPVDVPLVSRVHGYSIEHIAVNEYVDTAPAPLRYEGDTMILSIVKEEVITVKRLKVVEEIRITPVEKESTTNERVNLRKENIIVEKDPPDKNRD